MARLPPVAPDDDDPVVSAVFARFAREGRDPIELYRVLAHAPDVLAPYSALAQALRHDAQSPRELRELMILRTAQLTGSAYEWAHHRQMARQEGIDEAKVHALAAWPDAEVFDATERAALRCVDEMHGVALSDEAFAALRARVGAAQTVELVVLASVYQAIARMIQALGIEVEDAYAPFLEGLDGPPAGA
jgi:alkylhydroperoxidase family enzyme